MEQVCGFSGDGCHAGRFFWGRKRIFTGKRSITILLIFLMLFLLAGCQAPQAASSAEEQVKIAIATDLHYLAPTLTDQGEYFHSFVRQGDGKVIQYIEEITDAFCSEMLEKKPDILILSGDLTLNGAVESHNALIQKLNTLQEAGIQVLVIPGNHDVDREYAVSFRNDSVDKVTALTSQEFLALYEPFGPEQAISRDAETFSYSVRVCPDLSVIALDANCFGQGFVKKGTLQWLETQLKTAQEENAAVITVSHQNLYAHNPVLSFGYQLYNAADLLELLEKYGVKCHFSGHIHAQSIYQASVTEIVTSSLAVSPIQYGWVECTEDELTYHTVQTDVAGWAAEQGSTDAELLSFAEYADDFFREIGENQVLSAFAESDLSDAEKKLLADTFNELNAAYFAGREPDCEALQQGLALWGQQEGTFFLQYIKTLTDAGADRTSAVISLKP